MPDTRAVRSLSRGGGGRAGVRPAGRTTARACARDSARRGPAARSHRSDQPAEILLPRDRGGTLLRRRRGLRRRTAPAVLTSTGRFSSRCPPPTGHWVGHLLAGRYRSCGSAGQCLAFVRDAARHGPSVVGRQQPFLDRLLQVPDGPGQPCVGLAVRVGARGQDLVAAQLLQAATARSPRSCSRTASAWLNAVAPDRGRTSSATGPRPGSSPTEQPAAVSTRNTVGSVRRAVCVITRDSPRAPRSRGRRRPSRR